MAATKYKAGELIEIPDPAEITRPDGEVITVTGGRYLIEADGSYQVKKK
ncbi:hypothetical protein [Nocardioides nematodiphilus]|nr:hypothetical protein [Nocardioides nematodiphilus]MCA1984795.1 hypothetical protein [Nocardioides nematodiphilus]